MTKTPRTVAGIPLDKKLAVNRRQIAIVDDRVRSDNQTLVPLARASIVFKPMDRAAHRPVVNVKVVGDLDHGVDTGQIE